ncbi:LptF/LptG family permease [Anaeromyxobacter oryzisoli]|uniref:LptF/LptG family permease n=1 Tax=Anaeromyxobacter oryzisoli TaxID=2925408 RepID=UPI001F5A1C52|nr:LptF/LptG family permease [Anaeromyxobacter sp. SG63]
MRLLDRYLAKEILLPFGAALLFLTQLLLATQILGQAKVLFGSGVSLRDVALVILALLPYFLGFVLPIAFVLGVVVGVGRLAEDREVVALGAAGISPTRLVRVPLVLAAILAVVGGWLSLSVEPAGLRFARQRMNDIVKRNVMNDVRGGTFYDQIPGYTLYAERASGGRWENVLISDRSNPGAPVLALARRGRLAPFGDQQDVQLVLEDGEAHRELEQPSAEGADEYALAEFSGARMLIGLGTALTDRNGVSRSSREQTIGDYQRLAAEARAQGKELEAHRWEGFLQRKFSAALVLIPFAFIAVPLGANRRGGRAFGVGATFLVIVAHYLLLRGGEVLVQRGSLSPMVGLELPNAILGAVGLLLVGLMAHRGAGAVR